jgi:hypothetical protein
MNKLPVLLVGLALVAASCAPSAAPTQPAEASTPTVAPTKTTQTQEPTATLTTETATDKLEIAPTPGEKDFQPQLGELDIDMNEVVTLLPPDAIPAILPDRAAEIMVTAAEADAAGIDNGVQVIGISINGQSKAYPIPYLSRHEIVNDEVGGRLIAATW